MKKTSLETLHREHQPDAIEKRLDSKHKPQIISDAVLGGIDGCVTTFAIVAGAVGAGFSASVALIMGFANLFADGFSMAVSNYEAIKAQREFREKVRRMEEEHIDRVPDGELEEIRQVFYRKGFSGEILESIVGTISQDRQLWVETMLVEEHGLQAIDLDPIRSASATFSAFLLAGAIPLLPLFFSSLELSRQFLFSMALAASVFFSIGMLKSLVFAQPLLRAGLSTLLTGGAAASLAYLTGYVLRHLLAIT
ncbi:MAG TPA: VIT1/CCC1 transporter family protein [Pseudomonas sp.]|nr:VIT1/CCC1 transporter family protein [Pseudomonas sp.]